MEWSRPVRVLGGAAAIGVAPGTCPETSVALSTRGSALIATEDFYGTLQAGAGAWLRLQVERGSWLSLELPSVDYTFSANATITADRASWGPGSLSFHTAWRPLSSLRVAPFLRVLLPTETGYSRARRYGVEHGLALSWLPGSRWAVAGGLSFPLLATQNSGTWLNDYQALTTAELTRLLGSVWSLSGGVSTRLQPPRGGGALRSFAARVGVRLGFWGNGFAELAAAIPLAGEDRTDGQASLHVGWRR